MTDKHYESLSALLDNEVDELECHRIAEQTSEMSKSKLSRYAMASQLLQGQAGNESWCINVREAVSKEIEVSVSEENLVSQGNLVQKDTAIAGAHAHDEKFAVIQDKSTFAWGQMAVAASVMFVVMASFILFQGNPNHETDVAEQNVAEARFLDAKAEANLVAIAEHQIELNSVDSSVKVEESVVNFGNRPDLLAGSVSEAQRKKLNEYLLRHAGNGFIGAPQGVAPYARLASFSAEDN